MMQVTDEIKRRNPLWLVERLVEVLHEETVRANDVSMYPDDPVEDTYRDCDHLWCQFTARYLDEMGSR